MKSFFAFLTLLGRVLISAIFIWAGIGKIFFFNETTHYMMSKGMTLVPFFLFGALTIEILGGLAILIGFFARVGAMVLFLFLVPTTLIFHDFWNATEVEMQMQMILFLKNLNILGGLLYVITYGAGKWSVDWVTSSD